MADLRGGLMRAAAEGKLRSVAIPAQDLETRREMMTDQPRIKSCSDSLPMFGPVIVDMVYGQKSQLRNAATGAFASVGCHDFEFLPNPVPPNPESAAVLAGSPLGSFVMTNLAPRSVGRALLEMLPEKLLEGFEGFAGSASSETSTQQQLAARASPIAGDGI